MEVLFPILKIFIIQAGQPTQARVSSQLAAVQTLQVIRHKKLSSLFSRRFIRLAYDTNKIHFLLQQDLMQGESSIPPQDQSWRVQVNITDH